MQPILERLFIPHLDAEFILTQVVVTLIFTLIFGRYLPRRRRQDQAKRLQGREVQRRAEARDRSDRLNLTRLRAPEVTEKVQLIDRNSSHKSHL